MTVSKQICALLVLATLCCGPTAAQRMNLALNPLLGKFFCAQQRLVVASHALFARSVAGLDLTQGLDLSQRSVPALQAKEVLQAASQTMLSLLVFTCSSITYLPLMKHRTHFLRV